MIDSTDLHLDRESAAALLGDENAAIMKVELLRTQNHTWRVNTTDAVFYVKAHTKDWYQHKPASSGPVRHEVTGHRLLHEASIPAAEVISYATSRDNALHWPYVITRELPGAGLPAVLHALDCQEAEGPLRATGMHLSKMHALTYRHPGYLIDGPPPDPQPGQWLHWLCRMERFLLHLFENIAAHTHDVDIATNDAAASLLHNTIPQLRQAYQPLRFVHGDCHASTFFLNRDDTNWQVSGVVDMENCSAGAPAFDFVKLFIELAGHLGASTNWWQPLFDGYGTEPDFELIRLLLVGHAHINFTCLGEWSWPGTRANILNHILNAHNWDQLFNIRTESAHEL